jgi:hypothetical protein
MLFSPVAGLDAVILSGRDSAGRLKSPDNQQRARTPQDRMIIAALRAVNKTPATGRGA